MPLRDFPDEPWPWLQTTWRRGVPPPPHGEYNRYLWLNRNRPQEGQGKVQSAVNSVTISSRRWERPKPIHAEHDGEGKTEWMVKRSRWNRTAGTITSNNPTSKPCSYYTHPTIMEKESKGRYVESGLLQDVTRGSDRKANIYMTSNYEPTSDCYLV